MKSPSQPARPAPGQAAFSSRAGFSLIEVAVTIAIAAFIVSTVVTVVPMALGWHRDAIQTSVMSAAVQELVREIEQTPFYSASGRDITFYDTEKFYFDFEGTRLPDDVSPQDVVFQAQVFILDGGTGADVSGFLDRGTSSESSTLKRVVVAVLFKPGDKTTTLGSVSQGGDNGADTFVPIDNVKIHSLLIADRGADA